MNNTTTFSRSMFGLTTINADTVNTNNLVLTGGILTDLIQSSAPTKTITLEGQTTGNVVLKSGGANKIVVSNSITESFQSFRLRTGNNIQFWNQLDATNTFSIGAFANNLYFNNVSTAQSYIFQMNSSARFTISNTSITSTVYITAPTEAVGSNNTRLATTAFVTDAVTTSISGLPTLAGANAWTGNTNTFNSFLPTSTITATSANELCNYTTATGLVASANQKLTGITYSSGSDLTSIDNNVEITVPHILLLNGRDVDYSITELYTLFDSVSSDVTALYTRTTGMSYATGTTTFNTTVNFSTYAPTTPITATSANQLCNYSTTNALISSAISGTGFATLSGANTFTATNIFNNTLGIQTNAIQSTAATQSLTLEAQTTGSVNLKSNGANKITVSSTVTETFQPFRMRTGNQLQFWNQLDATNTFYIGAFANNLYFNNVSTAQSFIFQMVGSNRFTISNASITSSVYITAPTEAAGSNNTRLATTEFVTTAINNQVQSPLTLKLWEDEFFDGFSNSIITWTSSGTGTAFVIQSESHHPGIVRLSCGNGDSRSLYPARQTYVNFYWDDIVSFNCIFRITGNNNFTLLLGIYNSANAAENLYLNFDTISGTKMYNFRVNDFTVANLSTVPFTSGNWMSLTVNNLGGKMVNVILKDLITSTTQNWTSGSALTTINNTTGQYCPICQIAISDAPTKTLDIDYISINYKTARN